VEIPAADGKSYNTLFYNLDMIIAVGYRVNSKKATAFRIWAQRCFANRLAAYFYRFVVRSAPVLYINYLLIYFFVIFIVNPSPMSKLSILSSSLKL